MNDTGKYNISFFTGFADKAMEKEYLQNYMKNYSRLIGPNALIFGTIYVLFIIADYFDVGNLSSFIVILLIRISFFISSILLYLYTRKSKDLSNFAYFMTAYELWAVISFMAILYQYKTIGVMSFFSVMAVTSAIYLVPNKIVNAQIVSVLFNLSFFILFRSHMEAISFDMLLKIIAYDLLFIIFGNIGAFVTNFYKRKQFADNQELLNLSMTDPLTGIGNRAKLDLELQGWIDYYERYEEPLSLAVLDIDDFKKANDNYGHLIGDLILQNVATTIMGSIRSTDVFARWGGDEFALLLPNTNIHTAIEMIERLRHCIKESSHDGVGKITCSFGLVSLQKNEDAKSLLQRADQLLYSAKKGGKDTIAWAEADLNNECIP